ncbi:MAG TPA: hypothetical protein VMF89_33585, partial [Polyangiales bacterium]|nr:hypothetical protein [Polyangiales bacterium]
ANFEPLRTEELLAKPVWIEPAFDDAEQLMSFTRACAPFELAAKVHKLDDDGKDVPWFRIFWARGGELLDARAQGLFLNERFIEAAKESFGAKVIVPNSLMTNHNAPMAGGPPHLDLPFFRGATRFPFWLLVAMSYSGLFHRWSIPIASTLCWFYRGEGGDFEYWADGPDAPSTVVRPPLWNVGVVSDNEYMWHRVGPIGGEHELLSPGAIRRDALLHAEADGSWRIRDGAGFDQRFEDRQIRHSFLWKAYAFADERAHREYLDHSNDLSYRQTVEIFEADLARREIASVSSTNPVADPNWKKLIQRTYKARAVHHAK